MEKHYSLSEIVGTTKKVFDEFLGTWDFWFIAEIVKVKIYTNSVFLEFVEYENGLVKASISGIVSLKLYQEFLKDIRLSHLDDLKSHQLLMKGSIEFLEKYGVKIVVHEISREFTKGLLVKNQDMIRQQLIAEKIYTLNKQKKLGFPPYRIAVISAGNSEGYRDFIHILNESGFQYMCDLYDTKVHGNGALESVHQSLKKIYADIQRDDNIDLVVMLRGGGSVEGMLRQNDLAIARGVCHIQVPVMTAIGHTTDKSLLDEIVAIPCTTPTNAGHYLITEMQSYEEQLKFFYEQIIQLSREKMSLIDAKLEVLQEQIYRQSVDNVRYITEQIDVWYQAIIGTTPDHLTHYGYAILVDNQKKYLTKKNISALKKGDRFVINVYDREINVEIVE